jgi:hypothetical protein
MSESTVQKQTDLQGLSTAILLPSVSLFGEPVGLYADEVGPLTSVVGIGREEDGDTQFLRKLAGSGGGNSSSSSELVATIGTVARCVKLEGGSGSSGAIAVRSNNSSSLRTPGVSFAPRIRTPSTGVTVDGSDSLSLTSILPGAGPG